MKGSGSVPPHYISVANAAALWNCHPKTIRNLINDGKLTGYKVGRVLRVDPEELEAAFRSDGSPS
jgi:excisionase family DNA binding protein